MTAIFDNDWLLALAITAPMVGGLFAALALSGGMRRRRAARDAALQPEAMRAQFERTCRRLIDDLDRRMNALDELVKIADARIVELGSLNAAAESNRNKALVLDAAKGRAPAAPRSAHEEARLKDLLLREVGERLERSLAEYKHELADYKRRIEERMAPLAILSEPLPGLAPAEPRYDADPPDEDPADGCGTGRAAEGGSTTAGFAPYEPDLCPAVAGGDDGLMRRRMRDVENLARSGLPVDEICLAVRMERKAVETILRLAGITPSDPTRMRPASSHAA